MATIERVEILQVDIAPKVVRTDAIQALNVRGANDRDVQCLRHAQPPRAGLTA